MASAHDRDLQTVNGFREAAVCHRIHFAWINHCMGGIITIPLRGGGANNLFGSMWQTSHFVFHLFSCLYTTALSQEAGAQKTNEWREATISGYKLHSLGICKL